MAGATGKPFGAFVAFALPATSNMEVVERNDIKKGTYIFTTVTPYRPPRAKKFAILVVGKDPYVKYGEWIAEVSAVFVNDPSHAISTELKWRKKHPTYRNNYFISLDDKTWTAWRLFEVDEPHTYCDHEEGLWTKCIALLTERVDSLPEEKEPGKSEGETGH